jgi:hypothetical protein
MKQSEKSKVMVKDYLQLKTIEVCVNSDHELESQEEITQ